MNNSVVTLQIFVLFFFLNPNLIAQECFKINVGESIFEFDNPEISNTELKKELESFVASKIHEYLEVNEKYVFFSNFRNYQLIDLGKGKFYYKNKKGDKPYKELERNSITNPDYGIDIEWKATGSKKEINKYVCDEYIISKLNGNSTELYFYIYPDLPNINSHGFKNPLPGLVMKDQRWIFSYQDDLRTKKDSTKVNTTFLVNSTVCSPAFREGISYLEENFLVSKSILDTTANNLDLDKRLVESINSILIANPKFESLLHNIFSIRQFDDKIVSTTEILHGSFHRSFSKKDKFNYYIKKDKRNSKLDTIRVEFDNNQKLINIYDSGNKYSIKNDTILNNSLIERCHYYDKFERSYYTFTGKNREFERKIVYNSKLNIVLDSFSSGNTTIYTYDEFDRLKDKSKGDLTNKTTFNYGLNGLLISTSSKEGTAHNSYKIKHLENGNYFVKIIYNSRSQDDNEIMVYQLLFDKKFTLIEQKDNFLWDERTLNFYHVYSKE